MDIVTEKSIEKLINSVLDVSKYVFERKLVSGKAGNISGRIKVDNNNVIAITPTLMSLNRLSFNDIVLVDINGNNIDIDSFNNIKKDNKIIKNNNIKNNNGKPSSEVLMHTYIYKNRKDINGIVHTHSPYATGFSFSNKKLKRMEGFGKIEREFLKEIPYKKPGTIELAKHSSIAISDEDVLILKEHGVISVGKTIEEAGDLAEFVEETAKIQFVYNTLNNI
ncbi:MAG: class II aldolase/adducin family protein [Methanobrevibacter sp.]|jgi:L-fuculose-phosphate aldolase|nr:class II aldolase/adducin family protein [Candidatus Methanoflexus mossambicus]